MSPVTSEIDDCIVCLTKLTEKELYEGVCPNCISCLDCYEHAEQCMCYKPTVNSSQSLIDYAY